VAKALDKAKRPAIVAGTGVDRDGAVNLLVSLAEQHRAAVYTAPMSARCGFPESHDLFGGFLPAMRERIVATLSEHDLVLVLGAPAFSYHVEGEGPHVPEGTALWQIVDDPHTAAWTPSGNSVVASLDLAIAALIDGTKTVKRRAPPRRQRASPEEAGQPMSVAYVLQALDQARGAHDVVVEEAPGSRGVMQQNLPMNGADSFYTMASGGLGFGMPAAVGVALGRQKQRLKGRTIALMGDGSSMYSIQALYTASQLNLPITFIILNNRCYAALQDFAPVFGYAKGDKPAGTDLPHLDFVSLANGQGVPASRVERPEQLRKSLETALAAKGPYLVELVVS
jgi:benzoylformate decarboxylase